MEMEKFDMPEVMKCDTLEADSEHNKSDGQNGRDGEPFDGVVNREYHKSNGTVAKHARTCPCHR